jgi:hypothetical protein
MIPQPTPPRWRAYLRRFPIAYRRRRGDVHRQLVILAFACVLLGLGGLTGDDLLIFLGALAAGLAFLAVVTVIWPGKYDQ